MYVLYTHTRLRQVCLYSWGSFIVRELCWNLTQHTNTPTSSKLTNNMLLRPQSNPNTRHVNKIHAFYGTFTHNVKRITRRGFFVRCLIYLHDRQCYTFRSTSWRNVLVHTHTHLHRVCVWTGQCTISCGVAVTQWLLSGTALHCYTEAGVTLLMPPDTWYMCTFCMCAMYV